MTNLPANSKINWQNRDETDSAIEKLLISLGPEKIILLSNELEKLLNEVGYGEVHIRIHDHRVQVVQILKTFK